MSTKSYDQNYKYSDQAYFQIQSSWDADGVESGNKLSKLMRGGQYWQYINGTCST